MLAPDWSQKMLCIIVPDRRTESPEFCLCVRARRLLSSHTCPVRSPRFRGKLSFSTLLTRNEGTTNDSGKRFGCYQQDHPNLHRENSVSAQSQGVVIAPAGISPSPRRRNPEEAL